MRTRAQIVLLAADGHSMRKAERHEHLHWQPHITGLRFLFRVTLRRPDPAAEIYHLREPQEIPT